MKQDSDKNNHVVTAEDIVKNVKKPLDLPLQIKHDAMPSLAFFQNKFDGDIIIGNPSLIDLNFPLLSLNQPSIDRYLEMLDVETKPILDTYIFIAMPINDSSDSVDTENSIFMVCENLGIQSERVDKQESNEKISQRIYDSIKKSDYVIADLTGYNPNVVFEAGYALGLEKSIIFICNEKDFPPKFDFSDFPIIKFKTYKSLRERLSKRLSELIKNNV